jgi:cob(I)alamin adenosyltransferase
MISQVIIRIRNAHEKHYSYPQLFEIGAELSLPGYKKIAAEHVARLVELVRSRANSA